MRALDQLATAVEMRLAKFFRRVGYFVADRPYSCIIGSILLAAVLSAGAVTIKSESRARELYAPSGNRGQKDLDLASGLFAAVEPEKRHNRYHDIRSSSRYALPGTDAGCVLAVSLRTQVRAPWHRCPGVCSWAGHTDTGV